MLDSNDEDEGQKTKVTKLGAKWNNGLNTSPFYWNLNNASSNRNRNISSQLVNALKHPVRNGGVLL